MIFRNLFTNFEDFLAALNDIEIMGKNQMKGKHLRKIDFPSDVAKSLALSVLTKHYKFRQKTIRFKIKDSIIFLDKDFSSLKS